jgi:NADPH-dependent ferric siderophore reductase
MSDASRTRQPAPPFRRAEVVAVTAVTSRLTRVTLRGEELVGIPMPEPAGSVRLLLPERDSEAEHGPGGLEIPTWASNNFVYADGRRPTLRTLTPVDTDPDRGELALAIVRHGAGRAAAWAEQVRPGAAVAISGPARGYVPSRDAGRFLIGGDETAIPALIQLAAAIPAGIPAEVLVEVPDPDARTPITDREGIDVVWIDGATVPGAALADAFTARTVGPDTHVWAGGEAAAMQRIRRHLYETLGVDRARATARGYWKHGRSASTAP